VPRHSSCALLWQKPSVQNFTRSRPEARAAREAKVLISLKVSNFDQTVTKERTILHVRPPARHPPSPQHLSRPVKRAYVEGNLCTTPSALCRAACVQTPASSNPACKMLDDLALCALRPTEFAGLKAAPIAPLEIGHQRFLALLEPHAPTSRLGASPPTSSHLNEASAREDSRVGPCRFRHTAPDLTVAQNQGSPSR
jgi:hypothetical protein